MTSNVEIYDWESRTRNDPRLIRMTNAISTILTNLRNYSNTLTVNEPPLSHYEKRASETHVNKTEESRHYISYHSSSSDKEPNEVDPMDYLSDFEPNGFVSGATVAVRKDNTSRDSLQSRLEESSTEDSADVPAKEADDDEACQICSFHGNDSKMLLCDSCDLAYHIYCLDPPLQSIPQGNWFCPGCVRDAYPGKPQIRVHMDDEESEDHAMTPPESVEDIAPICDVKIEQISEDPATLAFSHMKNMFGLVGAMKDVCITDKIAGSFHREAESCNQLLIHACSCEAPRCNDTAFSTLCDHMKRFLRSAAWASHNDEWLAFPIAAAITELFAYHSLRCMTASCRVPFCVDLRKEELV